MANPLPSAPPRPITPTGTPPGTHTIDRADRETFHDSLPTPPPSRRPSFLSSLASLPFSFSPSNSIPSTPASTSTTHSRRESFNHGLGFGMTPASNASAVVDDHEDARGHAKKRSLSMLDRALPSGRDVPHLPPTAAHPDLPAAQPQAQALAATAPPTPGPNSGAGITRPKSTPHLPRNKQGFDTAAAEEGLGVQANVAGQGPPATTGGRRASDSGRRHFDPSRDPRLLGLI
ncbi:hypothetical protein L198_02205 [Cryptococcus wingfieldii CBS 7118]|uniref:Uncharacterized protein n=1 Tax=Cryptococcus wingfieldii CBS 7118 TaxID=1295528 RepID=A0A1E3JR52_9TREE|nr:hypothetical protein L198_02205 [Cryptococcus wingfieldii CBS 7118]ODO03359.1 hypothetical protein L198_02205 [Cryptococcus wingfieldii CBS 7118]